MDRTKAKAFTTYCLERIGLLWTVNRPLLRGFVSDDAHLVQIK